MLVHISNFMLKVQKVIGDIEKSPKLKHGPLNKTTVPYSLVRHPWNLLCKAYNSMKGSVFVVESTLTLQPRSTLLM